MHDVNWCETCGSMINVIQLRKPGPDGLVKLFNVQVCDCRGKPRPAHTDHPVR